MGINGTSIFFALTGGILPALFWLWFWLKEDKEHPEPRGLILLAFLVGMLAVPLVIPLQKFVSTHVLQDQSADLLLASDWRTGLLGITLWVVIEELTKFLLAYILVLRRKAVDEPIDPLMYMITIALGFSALENSLFLLNPLNGGHIMTSLITGNLRFMGATLLHVASSSAIGIAMAFGFYKRPIYKELYILWGVILSIALHTIFNLFIILTDGKNIFTIFFGVWCVILCLLLFFERIKKIHR